MVCRLIKIKYISSLYCILISWQIVSKTVMVDNISTHNIKPQTTRKVDKKCISWVVICTTILCPERSHQDLIISSIKGTIQLAVKQPPLARGHVLITSYEKQPSLLRGHVQTQWPLPRTCNQGTVETCFDATTSFQRTTRTDNY